MQSARRAGSAFVGKRLDWLPRHPQRCSRMLPAEAIRRLGPVPGQAQALPVGPASSCARDAERLARLRENPTVEAISRLEKELGCEHMRPQLQRLRESTGQ